MSVALRIGALALLFSPASAAPPLHELLPASTRFYVSITNGPDFDQRLDQTQLGRLLADPQVKPFLNDFAMQLKGKAGEEYPLVRWLMDMGIGWNQLRDLASGELAWALIESDAGEPSLAFLADVAGRQELVHEMVQEIEASMAQRAQRSQQTVRDTVVTSYKIPAAGKIPQRATVYFVKDQLFVAASETAAALRLLEAIESPPAESLKQHAAFQHVLKECRLDAGDQVPQVVLYLVPVDLGESLRALGANHEAGSIDPIAVARQQKFDALQAVGAFIHIGESGYDFHCRVSAYAPRPWTQSMQVCEFPNGTLAPAAWVSEDFPMISMLRVDFPTAARHVGPLFDALYAEGDEGLYEDIKSSLLEDPDGPQIDVDKELFGRLSPQVSLAVRNALPITPDSPQKVIAIATTDEQGLVEPFKQALEGYAEVEIGELSGHEAYFGYEVDAESTDSPAFVATVAKGHVFLATDAAVLEHVLTSVTTNCSAKANPPREGRRIADCCKAWSWARSRRPPRHPLMARSCHPLTRSRRTWVCQALSERRPKPDGSCRQSY